MKKSPRAALAVALRGRAGLPSAPPSQCKPHPPASALTAQRSRRRPSSSAASFVAGRPSVLHASTDDAYVQHPVISSAGLQYIPYDRTYKGLPVVGGDFVVVVDAAGQVNYNSVAQTQAIGNLAVTPTLTSAAARPWLASRCRRHRSVEGTKLVVVRAPARRASRGRPWSTARTPTARAA